jgi:hypothetical protein
MVPWQNGRLALRTGFVHFEIHKMAVVMRIHAVVDTPGDMAACY